MIKFLDLQKINLQYQEEIEAKLLETFRSGWYLLGNKVKNFTNYIDGKNLHKISIENLNRSKK